MAPDNKHPRSAGIIYSTPPPSHRPPSTRNPKIPASLNQENIPGPPPFLISPSRLERIVSPLESTKAVFLICVKHPPSPLLFIAIALLSIAPLLPPLHAQVPTDVPPRAAQLYNRATALYSS